MTVSIREQRWSRFESAYGRLPIWLQAVLFPWTIPARFLIFFPILTPTLCLSGAAFLAYLKLYYLHEQVTWSQVRMMLIAPLVAPVLACYIACFVVLIVASLFVGPTLVIVVLVRWWTGEPLRPFSLDLPGKRGRSSRGDRLLWDRDLDG
jgi:hypothetical protein